MTTTISLQTVMTSVAVMAIAAMMTVNNGYGSRQWQYSTIVEG